MSEQKNIKRERPPADASPGWRFPKIAARTPAAQTSKGEPRHRLPATLFGGKVRTSTLALLVLYVVFDVSKKPIPPAQSPSQPWAPPTNAVFGPDGNWTVPAQVPTTQQYPYRPQRPATTTPPETTETPTPTTSGPESTSGSPSASGSPNPSASPNGSEPSHSRSRGQDDSRPSTSPSGSAANPDDARPRGSAEPGQTRSRPAAAEDGRGPGSGLALP